MDMEDQERCGDKNRIELHPTPVRIRLSDKHHLAGRELVKHEGISYSLDIGGGLIIFVQTGDYIGVDCHMPLTWLLDNPEMWDAA